MGFKMSALVIVALLWVSVTGDERQAQPVSTQVFYEVADSSWVLVSGPTEVSTTFQGRNRELLGLLMEEPLITVQIDSVEGPDMRVPLPLDQVVYNRDLRVAPSFITPEELDLRFEPRVTARIVVEPDIEAMPAAGFTVLAPLLVEPDSVTVRGPASWVEDLTRIATRRVELQALSNTVIRDVGLRIPANVQGVDIEPPSVLVTINLDSLVVRRRRVAVQLQGAGATQVSVEPDSVTVVVRGASSIVAAELDSLNSLIVDVPARLNGPEQRVVSIVLEGRGPVAADVEPAVVTLSPRP